MNTLLYILVTQLQLITFMSRFNLYTKNQSVSVCMKLCLRVFLLGSLTILLTFLQCTGTPSKTAVHDSYRQNIMRSLILLCLLFLIVGRFHHFTGHEGP